MMKLRIRTLTMLCLAWMLGSVIAQPTYAREGRGPLLMPGKTTLYQRVLTRPGAKLQRDPVTPVAESAIELTPFSVYYVFDRKIINGVEWLELGARQREPTNGWLDAGQAVDWKQTLTVAFTNPAGRQPVLLFRNSKAVSDLLESETVIGETARLRTSIQKGEIGPSFPVISIEPGTYIDVEEQPYLLPILSAEEVWFSSGFTARLLEIASVPLAQGPEETLDDPEVRKRAIDGTAPPAPKALRDYRAGIAFVIDTTISMQPYIDGARRAVKAIYARIEEAGLLDKVNFALIGYRDHIKDHPRLEYLSKVFADLSSGSDPKIFIERLATVAEAPVSSRGFIEDAYAGIHTALEKLRWDDYGGRIIVLITDAGARKGSDQLSRTRMNAGEIRSLALSKGAAIYTLHLLTREGRANHRSAEAQYQVLSDFPNVGSLYFPVDAGSVAQYEQVVQTLAQTLIRRVNAAINEGTLGGSSADAMSGGSSPANVSGLVEAVEIPANERGPVTSQIALQEGVSYTLEASGEFGVWNNLTHGVDAVWCYDLGYCGKDGTVWNQLLVSGRAFGELMAKDLGVKRNPPFNPQHVYRTQYLGAGKPLEFTIRDSIGGSFNDNNGTITVRIYAPKSSVVSETRSAVSGDDLEQLKEVERKTQMLGRVMQLAYLGRKTETRAPRLLRAWTIDRDIENPDTATLDVRLLLSKNQLSDLYQALKTIVDTFETAGDSAVKGSRDFFNEIKSAAAAMGRDPSQVGKRAARNLADLGLMGEYLDDLPYQTKFTSIDEDYWSGMGAARQRDFIDEIKSKMNLYVEYDKRAFPLVEGASPGDYVFPVRLEDLP